MPQTRDEHFEHYRIERYLGATAWASSYVAFDEQLSKAVRLKVMRPYISRDQSYVQTLLERLSQIHGTQHSNVIPILRWGLHAQSLFLVSEYDENRLPLANEATLSPEQVVRVLTDLSQALEHFADLGIYHLGVKPSNIFLGEDGKIWLSDFGIHPLPSPEDNSRHIQLSSKSAAFMAPELRTEQTQATSADIYSMGILAYLLCSGNTPFSSIIPEAIFAEQGLERIQPLSSYVGSVPQDVDADLLRAVARNPSSRQSSWKELIDTFQKLSSIKKPNTYSQEVNTKRRSPYLRSSTSVVPSIPTDPIASEMLFQCQRCGHMNLYTANHCESCRGRLHDSLEITSTDVEVIVSKARRKRNRKRYLRLGGTIIAAGMLFGFISSQTGTFTQEFIPAEATDLTLTSDSSPGNWAMHRGSTNRSGATTEPYGLPGEVIWTFNTQPIKTVGDDESTFLDDKEIPNSPLFATPAVVDGIVYLPTGDRRIVALNADNGKLIWEQPTSGPINAPPAVAGDLLYIGLRDSQMLALDRFTGTLRWTFKATNPIFAGPLVYDGLLYITSVDGTLHVVDALTGSLILQADLGGTTFASPAVSGDIIVASTGEKKLVILDRETGIRRFTFDLKSASASTPSIVGNKIIVPSQNTTLWAIDWMAQQGTWEERWYRLRMQMWIMGIIDSIESRTGFIWLSQLTKGRDSVLGSPAISAEQVIYCSLRGHCASVDISTGDQIWNTDIDEQIFSSPVIAGQTVYIGTNGNRVYGLDRTTGQKLWEFETDGKVTADIVPANGMFFIASQGGTLYALSSR